MGKLNWVEVLGSNLSNGQDIPPLGCTRLGIILTLNSFQRLLKIHLLREAVAQKYWELTLGPKLKELWHNEAEAVRFIEHCRALYRALRSSLLSTACWQQNSITVSGKKTFIGRFCSRFSVLFFVFRALTLLIRIRCQICGGRDVEHNRWPKFLHKRFSGDKRNKLLLQQLEDNDAPKSFISEF